MDANNSLVPIVGKMWARSGHEPRFGRQIDLLTSQSATRNYASDLRTQKSQSSSSVTTALPITYDEPEPEKKSWFSSALGDSADRMAGFTSVSSRGNSASYPRFISALLAL